MGISYPTDSPLCYHSEAQHPRLGPLSLYKGSFPQFCFRCPLPHYLQSLLRSSLVPPGIVLPLTITTNELVLPYYNFALTQLIMQRGADGFSEDEVWYCLTRLAAVLDFTLANGLTLKPISCDLIEITPFGEIKVYLHLLTPAPREATQQYSLVLAAVALHMLGLGKTELNTKQLWKKLRQCGRGLSPDLSLCLASLISVNPGKRFRVRDFLDFVGDKIAEGELQIAEGLRISKQTALQ